MTEVQTSPMLFFSMFVFIHENTFAVNHCLKSTTYKRHKIQVIPALWCTAISCCSFDFSNWKARSFGFRIPMLCIEKGVLHTSGLICYFYATDNEIVIGYEHHKSMYPTYLVLKVLVAGGAVVFRKFSWHTVDAL